MSAVLRRAKVAGITALEAWRVLVDGRHAAAAQQRWRPSELAAALADDFTALEKVYGKRAAALAREQLERERHPARPELVKP